MTWRTVRAVIEVPTRGDFTEKDLRWTIDRALSRFWRERSTKDLQFGTVRVKEYGRHITALKRQKEL